MKKILSALERQKAIYLDGFAGKRPRVPTHNLELEEAARKRAPANGFAYISGGAGTQDTMLHNRHGFKKWEIRPKMLRDVSERDLSIQLLGKRLPSPILAAPIGALDIVHPQADLAVARACAEVGVPMIFSNQASYPMEVCAAEMGATPRWFQLYWSKSNELVESFLQRAEACACEAIVLTLDTTMLGWRPRDLDLGFLPFSYAKGIGQYVSDPIFQKLVAESGDGSFEGEFSLMKLVNFIKLVRNYKGGGRFLGNLRSRQPLKAARKFTEIYSRPSITWEDLKWLKSKTKLPILLKGILHPEDAQRALDAGVQGIIVSNHGGRQIGGTISSMDALGAIIEQVKGQIPVLLDSGVRDGADIFKALAFGANAVCIGRPYAYGLAIAGERGVREVLQNLIAEFELTMGLSGCRNISEISPEFLIKAAL